MLRASHRNAAAYEVSRQPSACYRIPAYQLSLGSCRQRLQPRRSSRGAVSAKRAALCAGHRNAAAFEGSRRTPACHCTLIQLSPRADANSFHRGAKARALRYASARLIAPQLITSPLTARATDHPRS